MRCWYERAAAYSSPHRVVLRVPQPSLVCLTLLHPIATLKDSKSACACRLAAWMGGSARSAVRMGASGLLAGTNCHARRDSDGPSISERYFGCRNSIYGCGAKPLHDRYKFGWFCPPFVRIFLLPYCMYCDVYKYEIVLVGDWGLIIKT